MWSAWEAIGTVSAVVLTLLILTGSKILNYLSSPNIKASKPEICYHEPQQGDIRGRISLTWHIQNKPRLFFFGGIAVNVLTKYWLDKKEHEGWKYSGNIEPLPILPINEKWIQYKIFYADQLEDAEYILILVFYQTGLKDKDREDVIGHSKLTIRKTYGIR